MDSQQQRALLEGCLGPTLAREPPTNGPETHIPVSVYLDEERFAAEQAIHRRALNLVAHSSELPSPGSFLTLAGTPILLIRGEDGIVRAFLNVCRHRGATVERRSHGSCRQLVCPYHAWTYRTDGALKRVRHAEGFPSLQREDLSLTALTCVEHGPFIWVCPDPDQQPTLDEGARQLTAEIEALGLGALSAFSREGRVWRANWKLLVEGGLESYHFKIAHRQTIGSLFADTTSTFARVGDHIRSILPRASIRDLVEAPDEAWRLLKHANVLFTFSPNASVLAQDGHFAMILMMPVSADQTRIEMITVGRPIPEGERAEKVRAFLEANHRLTVKTLEEDFVLAEEIQRGLASGANTVLRMGTFEDALTDWHRWLDDRLSPPGR